MKIFFCGLTGGNAGPSNVNKGMVSNITDSFLILKSRNKYMQALEIVFKAFCCDVTVLSGVSRQGMIACRLSKICRKKAVYIMHGCAEYETKINHQQNVEKGLKWEKYILENADLLLPVSKKFMYWLQDRYPQYVGKMRYLYNGIDVDALGRINAMPKKRGSIVATGADRGVKKNITVANAVESMDGFAELTVCGAIYHGVPMHFRYTQYTGVISHEEFIQKLAQTELFVLNSVFESFSIATIEALMCGCSVLVSEVAGVTDILALEETDLIHDPMDVEEIRGKIAYLLEHPNNERILSKLDIEEYSYAKQVQRLEALCKELIQKT